MVLDADPARTVESAYVLAYGIVALGSAILLAYLRLYATDVAADLGIRDLLPLTVGIGAGVVYGIAGIADVLTGVPWLATFAEGATLFFILGVALGIRKLYRLRPTRTADGLPRWVDALVLGGFVASWWAGFLVGSTVRPVVVVGWVGASVWALYYSVVAVRAHEGTSIAALVRTLLPAVIAVTVAVFADVVGAAVGAAGLVSALWLVATVLVGAFLFTTAVAIRQQGGQVQRLYDWTTWREGAGDDRPTDD
jgi:hypothetical protein